MRNELDIKILLTFANPGLSWEDGLSGLCALIGVALNFYLRQIITPNQLDFAIKLSPIVWYDFRPESEATIVPRAKRFGISFAEKSSGLAASNGSWPALIRLNTSQFH